MPTHPKPSAKNDTGEYEIFQNALRKVLSVTHSEMQEMIKSIKRKRSLKRVSASRASREKD